MANADTWQKDSKTLASLVSPKINQYDALGYSQPQSTGIPTDLPQDVLNNIYGGSGKYVQSTKVNTDPTNQTPYSYTATPDNGAINEDGTYPTDQSTPTLRTMVAPTAPTVKDNSGLISSMYDSQGASAIATLKAMIAKNISDQQALIQKAPGQYAPLENTASANGQQNMQNLREMLANGGQQGGVNRTEETQVSANTQNSINSLEMQKQGVIDTANRAIADATAQGNLDEAKIIADTANQKLAALIGESNRVESETYSRGQDTFNNSLKLADYTGELNGTKTMAGTANELTNQLTKLNIDTSKLNLAALPQSIKDQATVVSQQIESGKISIDTGKVQLAELTDPNSVTNQMNQLGLNTAQLNFKALPQQIQDAATKLKQDIDLGKINIDVAKKQYTELTDPNSVTNKLAGLNLKIADFNYNQLDDIAKQNADKIADDLLTNAMSRKQAQAAIDHIGDSAQIQRDQLAWDKSSTNPKNIKPSTALTNTVDDYAATMKSLYVTPATSNSDVVIDTDGMKAYLGALETAGVDPAMIKQVGNRFGIIVQ